MVEPQQGEVVLIGKKPTMNYVIACLTLFNSGKQTITVRARGLVISHAVDTVELLRRAFIKDLKVQKIIIGSQEFQNASGFLSNVSTIDIQISKSGQWNIEQPIAVFYWFLTLSKVFTVIQEKRVKKA